MTFWFLEYNNLTAAERCASASPVSKRSWPRMPLMLRLWWFSSFVTIIIIVLILWHPRHNLLRQWSSFTFSSIWQVSQFQVTGLALIGKAAIVSCFCAIFMYRYLIFIFLHVHCTGIFFLFVFMNMYFRFHVQVLLCYFLFTFPDSAMSLCWESARILTQRVTFEAWDWDSAPSSILIGTRND